MATRTEKGTVKTIMTPDPKRPEEITTTIQETMETTRTVIKIKTQITTKGKIPEININTGQIMIIRITAEGASIQGLHGRMTTEIPIRTETMETTDITSVTATMDATGNIATTETNKITIPEIISRDMMTTTDKIKIGALK